MSIYFVACITSMCIAYFGTHSKGYLRNVKNSKIGTVVFSSIPLFLVSALRYGIGTDYYEYIKIYLLYAPRGLRTTIEPLFFGLNKIVYSLAGENYQWIIVAYTVLYLGFVFAAIYSQSESPVMSIFLLVSMTFYMSYFNTTREHIGCAILLFSVYFLERKNLKLFLICVLAATGFHYICAVFLIAYIFVYQKITPRKAIVYTGLFTVSQSIVARVVNTILSNNLRYARYLANESTFNINSLFGIAIQISILGLAMYVYKYNRDNKKYNIYMGIQMLAVWVNIFSTTLPMASRVKWVFSMPSIIFIPMLLSSIPKKAERQIITIITSVAFIAYAVIVVGVFHSYGVIPYISIFDK